MKNYLIIRIDSNDKVSNSFDIKRVPFSDYDAVIVSDYDKGYLTYEDIRAISESHPLTFIDTKKPLNELMKDYTFIKINEVEWENCKGQQYETWQDKLIVTMSERGAMYDGKTFPVNNDIEVRDLSGAGDTFIASLVVSYLKTANIERSIEYANDNATLVVQKKGVVTI
jgi:bifunctional ADP-heptose synthase (sugar kinase/adenylyltransferase)